MRIDCTVSRNVNKPHQIRIEFWTGSKNAQHARMFRAAGRYEHDARLGDDCTHLRELRVVTQLAPIALCAPRRRAGPASRAAPRCCSRVPKISAAPVRLPPACSTDGRADRMIREKKKSSYFTDAYEKRWAAWVSRTRKAPWSASATPARPAREVDRGTIAIAGSRHQRRQPPCGLAPEWGTS